MSLSRRRLLTSFGTAAAAALLARFPAARLIRAQTGPYDLIDLWTFSDEVNLGGFSLRGSAVVLNDDGIVAGNSAANGKISPSVWSKPGKPKLLKSGKYGGSVLAINRSGVAVGFELADETGTVSRPLLWRDGEKISLGLPEGTAGRIASGTAWDINDDGVAVGHCSIEGEGIIGVRWNDDEAELLVGIDGKDVHPEVITAAGLVVGRAAVAGIEVQGTTTAFDRYELAVWRETTPTILDRPEDVDLDLQLSVNGVTAANQALVACVDFFEDAVGTSYVIDLENGDAVALTGLSDAQTKVFGQAINDDGTIVGYAKESESPSVPVLWTDMEPVALEELVPDDAGIDVTSAIDINNDGVILCHGVDDDGALHAVLLVPVS